MKKTKARGDMPLGGLTQVADFLPPPHVIAKAIRKKKKEKITLEVDAGSVMFFKKQAKKYGVPYQAMIRALLDDYASRAGKA